MRQQPGLRQDPTGLLKGLLHTSLYDAHCRCCGHPGAVWPSLYDRTTRTLLLLRADLVTSSSRTLVTYMRNTGAAVILALFVVTYMRNTGGIGC